jgi:hypothetical protein
MASLVAVLIGALLRLIPPAVMAEVERRARSAAVTELSKAVARLRAQRRKNVIDDPVQHASDLELMVTHQRPGQSEMLEANRLVNGNRQADYGTPRENYEGIARVWSGILFPILKRDITPAEAALMMVGLKLQRQAMKHKRDNLVDAHGYLLVYNHIIEEEKA